MDAQTFQTFTFEVTQIRTILDDNGEPLFCLTDVCKALDLQNPTNTVIQIKEEFELPMLNIGSFDTGYGVKSFTMITEPQLYFVMMRSRAKIARQFRQWIVNEVLPALRKHGHYEIPSVSQQPKDELSDKDLTKIRDCIYRCANQFTYGNAFISGAWYALRKATGVKSPDKFGYKHLDIIAKELQHMQHIADMYAKVKFKVEEELIKKCVRENGTTGELFEILSNMTVQLTNCDFDKIKQLKSPAQDLMLEM